MITTSTRWWPRLVARVGHLIDRLYRWRLGWLFANRFAVLTHVGRSSGRTYRTALWVYRYQPDTGKITVVSVWGESDWYRNIHNTPATLIQIGQRSIVPEQEFLSTDDIGPSRSNSVANIPGSPAARHCSCTGPGPPPTSS